MIRRLLTAIAFFAVLILAGVLPAHAQTSDRAQQSGQGAPAVSAAAIKLDLIKQMEVDGFLSHRMAQDAALKYVNPADLSATPATPATAASAAGPALAARPDSAASQASETWISGLLSWSGLLKVVAVIALLISFAAFLGTYCVALVLMVPKAVYQAVFLAASLLLTFRPQSLWLSESVYLALFGGFATLLVLSWIVDSYPKLRSWLDKINFLGLNSATWKSLAAMGYFAGLAVLHQSAIFGFFCVVALSAVLNFGISYGFGVMTLSVKDRGVAIAVFGHLTLLALYAGMKITGNLPQQAALFAPGVEYYGTIAMGVGFLLGAAPLFGQSPGKRAGYLGLFIVVALAASLGYHLFGLKVIGSITMIFGTLIALEWLAYISYKAGFVGGTLLAGSALYGISLLIERYSGLIVLSLS